MQVFPNFDFLAWKLSANAALINWISDGFDLWLIQPRKMHTIICANILKCHWILHFNIVDLHASKELKLYLWNQAPLSQFIHPCSKRESMTCSHSRTRLSISEKSVLHQSALKRDTACPSLVTRSILLCHHPLFSIHFYHTDLWDNRKLKGNEGPTGGSNQTAAPRCVVHIEQWRYFLSL